MSKKPHNSSLLVRRPGASAANAEAVPNGRWERPHPPNVAHQMMEVTQLLV